MAKRYAWDEERPYEEIEDPAALYDAVRAAAAAKQAPQYPSAGNGGQQAAASPSAPQYQVGMEPINYENAGDYVSRNEAMIRQLAGNILNRPEFSYDYAADPVYQSYAKQYRREGQRAAADTLGQAAALTGGRPSSYAVTASQQAGNYYAAQLADKIPELYQAAYNRYMDADSRDRQNLNALLSLEDMDYGRWQDAYQRAWNEEKRDYDRGVYADETAYKRGRDAIEDARYAGETAYKRGRDAVADARYADETAYERGQQALKNNMALAELGISMGDYSMLRNLGFTDEQIAAYTEKYNTERDAAIAQQEEENAQAWAKILSGGSSGSSKTRPDYMDESTWAGLQDYIARMGDDADVENYLAANGNLGFGSTDNALSGWELYNQETEKQTADDAIAALRDAGVPEAVIERIPTKEEWTSIKGSKQNTSYTYYTDPATGKAVQYKSYEDFLTDFIPYLISQYGG